MTDGNAVHFEPHSQVIAQCNIWITYKDVGNVRHFSGA